MQGRTKEADFKILDETATYLANILAIDENKRELDEQFTNRDFGHHRYFLQPYHQPRDEWGPTFSVQKMISLPTLIQEDLNKSNYSASFMGILPEINRVWITMDNKIIFWNYLTSHEIDRYDGLSEPILSVSLSSLKTRVFLDAVKYLVVISTTTEVVVLAISYNEINNDMKIIPTTYNIATEYVPMVKILGTQNGRIFMGGQDGNLYELDYDVYENKWASFIGLEGIHYKCQKVNHNKWFIKALLPPVIRLLLIPEESMRHLVIDETRHVLYTITSLNYINVLYLGVNNQATQYIIHNYDVQLHIINYLDNIGRGFDTVPNKDCFSSKKSVHIISFHVIPLTESKNVHAVAVLESGIRVYFQLMVYSDIWRKLVPITSANIKDNVVYEPQLIVVFVKGPPTATTLNELKQPMFPNMPEGYLPLTNNRNAIQVSTAYYSHGVFISALKSEDALAPDVLLGIGEDLILRKAPLAVHPALSSSPSSKDPFSTSHISATSSSLNASSSSRDTALLEMYNSLPSMRENVTIIDTLEGRSVANYKIFDIQESCSAIHNLKYAALFSMYVTSFTPRVYDIKDKSHISYASSSNNKNTNGQDLPSLSPLFYTLCLAAAHNKYNATLSYTNNSQLLTTLSEFTLQVLPLPSKRYFLALTRYGILVITKQRPIDYLIQTVLRYDGDLDNAAYFHVIQDFFVQYGPIESLAMCIEILCNLPSDASSLKNIEAVTQATIDVSILRDRIKRVIRKMSGRPQFKVKPAETRSSDATTSSDWAKSTATSLPSTFFYSSLHDATYVVLGRILRVVWLKPLIENKLLSTIWNIDMLTTVRLICVQFKQFLYETYPEAVRKDYYFLDEAPTNIQTNAVPYINGNTGGNTLDMITHQITQNQIKIVNVNQSNQLELEATTREHKSIHKYYRLLSRSNQALSLIQILIQIERTYSFKIPWSDISDNISFRTFVISPLIHDKIKRVLHNLIQSLTLSYNVANANQKINDELTEKLTEECYYYYSAGDRYSYEVAKNVDLIRKELTSNNEVETAPTTLAHLSQRQSKVITEQKIEGLLYLLLKACRYWTPSDVREDVLIAPAPVATTTTAGTTAAAPAPVANKSFLSIYSDYLYQLGDTGRVGVVKLCLATAANFQSTSLSDGQNGLGNGRMNNRIGDRNSGPSYGDDDTGIGGRNDISSLKSNSTPAHQSRLHAAIPSSALEWDKKLYHLNAELSERDKYEARLACYQCLIDHLNRTLELQKAHTVPDITEASVQLMVDCVLESSADSLLRGMMYNALLIGDVNELLRIRAEDVVEFLHQVDDKYNHEYLYKYFKLHEQYTEAASHMHALAHSDADIPIETRLRYLRQAADCAAAAGESATFDRNPQFKAISESGSYSERLSDLMDEVTVAECQLDCCRQLRSLLSNDLMDSSSLASVSAVDKSMLHEVQNALLSIDTLFNQVALPFCLWGTALRLLHHSDLDAPDAVRKLWKSIIYRCVPMEASTAEGKQFLSVKRSADDIFFDIRRQNQQDTFEDTRSWRGLLETSIVSVGTALYTPTVTPYRTPPSYYGEKLLQELEELNAALTTTNSNMSKGWIVNIILQLPSFNYAVVAGLYAHLMEKWISEWPVKRIQLIASFSYSLEQWVTRAYERHLSDEEERVLLIQAIRCGRLHEWVNKIDRQINDVRGTLGRITEANRLKLLEAMDTMTSIRQIISELV